MKLRENGANEIKKFEGLRLKSYKCSGGVATIGYGHTANVRIGQQISKHKPMNISKMIYPNMKKK